jgi:hypothetical protein
MLLSNTRTIKICLGCDKENEQNALACEECGKPFAPMSALLTSDRTTPQLQPLPPQGTHTLASVGTLSIYIPGENNPVIVPLKDEFLLGRQAADEVTPIDLTSFRAADLGVSRRHAIIQFSASGGTLKDLGSSNGTWINENRLVSNRAYTLRSGDLLRLGHFLMFVYFSQEISSSHRIVLKTKASDTASLAAQGVTLGALHTDVFTYLDAVRACQEIVDEVLGRQPKPPFRVGSLQVEKDQLRIAVEVFAPGEVVSFIKKAPLLTSATPSISPKALNPEHAAKSLASALLGKVSSAQTDKERGSRMERLMPAFQQLLASKFIIMESL